MCTECGRGGLCWPRAHLADSLVFICQLAAGLSRPRRRVLTGHRPNGATGCSHGWSDAKHRGTRGKRAYSFSPQRGEGGVLLPARPVTV